MENPLAKPRRWYQFSLRALFFIVTFVAIWTTYFLWSHKMWSKTMRENAESFYWTMRDNLDRSRDAIAPASYEQLRVKIDNDWKRTNPGLEIPTQRN